MASDLGIDRIAGADGSTVILKVRGDLDLGGAATLRACLARLDADDVLVRLDDLDFLDSSGLAALLEARGAGRQTGRVVRFEGAAGEVRSLLVRTGTLAFIEG
jgi:anti-anti-sigma factor